MLTGGEKVACCQPDALSPVKVALANNTPFALQIFPTCVPLFPLNLKNRMPVVTPTDPHRNLPPTLPLVLPPSSVIIGAAVVMQIVHKNLHFVMVTGTPLDG